MRVGFGQDLLQISCNRGFYLPVLPQCTLFQTVSMYCSHTISPSCLYLFPVFLCFLPSQPSYPFFSLPISNTHTSSADG